MSISALSDVSSGASPPSSGSAAVEAASSSVSLPDASPSSSSGADTVSLSSAALALSQQSQTAPPAITPAIASQASQEFIAACNGAAYGTVTATCYANCPTSPIQEIDFGYVSYDLSSSAVSVTSAAQKGGASQSEAAQGSTEQASLTEEGDIATSYGMVNFEIQFSLALDQSQATAAASGQASLPDLASLFAAAQASGGSDGATSASAQFSTGSVESVSLTLTPSVTQDRAYQTNPASQVASLFSSMDGTSAMRQSANTFGVLDSLAKAAPQAADASAAASTYLIADTISRSIYSVYGTMTAGDAPPQTQLSQSTTDLQGTSSASTGELAWNAQVSQADSQFVMMDTYLYGLPDFAADPSPTLAASWSRTSASSSASAAQASSQTAQAANTDSTASGTGASTSPNTWQVTQSTTQTATDIATASVAQSLGGKVSPAAKILVAALKAYAPNIARTPDEDNPDLMPDAADETAAANSQTASASSNQQTTPLTWEQEAQIRNDEQPVAVQTSTATTASSASIPADPYDDEAKQMAQLFTNGAWSNSVDASLNQSKMIIELLDSLSGSISIHEQSTSTSSTSSNAPSAYSSESDKTTATTVSASTSGNV